jgi:hypothetical protein
VDKKMYCRSDPLLACVFHKKKTTQKKSCHSSLHPYHSTRRGSMGQTWWKSTNKIKYHHFVQQVYGWHRLFSYLDERWTVHYWKKVAFNITARMVLNRCTFYKENYREHDKLKSRYNYTVSIIENLGEKWLALNNNATVDDPQGP